MAPRITIIGGGSYQWAPKLLVDLANTRALHEAEVVLHDIDPAPLPRMVQFAEHLAAIRAIPLTARATTDRRAALEGADYVVVTISTGGFASMRHDLDVPARHGVQHSVGDTVGPGGVTRALRNIPVMLDIARDVEEQCPDAWLLNLTNPMTTICRALTRETPVKTIGLCHEVTITQFLLSLLLDVSFLELRPTVAGVNHLPFLTDLDAAGDDGFARLRALLEDPAAGEQPLAMDPPDDLGYEKVSPGEHWTKADLLHNNRVKLELFGRFGVLPGAGDRHLAEFFPNFLTEESGWGQRWGVPLTSIEERERDQQAYVDALEELLRAPEVPVMPSGEMVAPVIRCIERDEPGWFPLNIPNTNQVADLPTDVAVESICTVDGSGVRGRDHVALPAPVAEVLRRVSSSQELTVEAAVTGDRDTVFAAMMLDPLAGRVDYDRLEAMTDELLAATGAWLPQFTSD
jgi:alpha-galactosidase